MSERVSDERLAELAAFYDRQGAEWNGRIRDGGKHHIETANALRDLAAARASLDEALGLLREYGTDSEFDDYCERVDALLRKVGM